MRCLSEPREWWRHHQTTSLCLDFSFSIFLIALRRDWNATCSSWLVVESRFIFRLPFAAAESGSSMEPRAPCGAKQVAVALSVSHLPQWGLAVWVNTRHCFSQAGVCNQCKVRAVVLAYVADMPLETQKPRCLIPVRVPDLLNTEVCPRGGAKWKWWRWFCLLCLPRATRLQIKTCSALGQATRGNSELKEMDFFVESMKTHIWKSGVVELALLLFNKERAARHKPFFLWCPWWYFGVQYPESRQQQGRARSKKRDFTHSTVSQAKWFRNCWPCSCNKH